MLNDFCHKSCNCADLKLVWVFIRPYPLCYSGLLHEQNMAKMRLLTFMGMAVENKEISFDTMQQELQIGADDVEAFVIDGKAIRMFSFFP